MGYASIYLIPNFVHVSAAEETVVIVNFGSNTKPRCNFRSLHDTSNDLWDITLREIEPKLEQNTRV